MSAQGEFKKEFYNVRKMVKLKMNILNYFRDCFICKNSVLIEVHSIGPNRIAGINIMCKECLKKQGIDEKFILDETKQ